MVLKVVPGKKDVKQIDTREMCPKAVKNAMKEKNAVIWERITEWGLICLVCSGRDL